MIKQFIDFYLITKITGMHDALPMPGVVMVCLLQYRKMCTMTTAETTTIISEGEILCDV